MKEYAYNLVIKFYLELNDGYSAISTKKEIDTAKDFNFNLAKKLAMICIDEILSSLALNKNYLLCEFYSKLKKIIPNLNIE